MPIDASGPALGRELEPALGFGHEARPVPAEVGAVVHGRVRVPVHDFELRRSVAERHAADPDRRRAEVDRADGDAHGRLTDRWRPRRRRAAAVTAAR